MFVFDAEPEEAVADEDELADETTPVGDLVAAASEIVDKDVQEDVAIAG